VGEELLERPSSVSLSLFLFPVFGYQVSRNGPRGVFVGGNRVPLPPSERVRTFDRDFLLIF
jgi:hypothetical protein